VLSLFKRAQKNVARAGIAFSDRQVTAVVVSRSGPGRPSLVQCVSQSTTDTAPDQVLPGIIDKLSLARTAVSAVMGADDYQLVQIEAPEVLPAELRAAVRWRLREAIDFDIDEATIDLFEIPDQSRRARAKMLFAVAARTATVQRIGNTLARHAPGFDVIDIPELCLRNLSALTDQDQKGVAMLMLREQFGQLALTRQGVLYLTRRIELGKRTSLDIGDTTGGRDDIDTGALALELQRSLDYYESHYDQTPIGELVLAPDSERVRALAETLARDTGLRVSAFDVKQRLDVAEGVEVPTDWLSLTALGAALRPQIPER
jgi:MSHA biogenesis protein MshI